MIQACIRLIFTTVETVIKLGILCTSNLIPLIFQSRTKQELYKELVVNELLKLSTVYHKKEVKV